MRPQYLKIGDEVALVSPAGKTDSLIIDQGINILQSWGLIVTPMPHVYGSFHQFSGSSTQRAEDLQEAINSPKFRAIICVRGGYGCSKIVDNIDFSPLFDYPKWLVGFSDITVLHAQLHRLRIESIHGAVIKGFPNGISSLKEALFGTLNGYKIENHPLNRNGNAVGVVVGGNLTLINNMIGTASDIFTMGKILFIEDVDEQLYHLDRLMVQLRRSGKLAHLSGLIAGCFHNMHDGIIPFGASVEEIILDAVVKYKYPVCFNFPAGHIKDNRAFYLGRKSKLSVQQDMTTLNFI